MCGAKILKATTTEEAKCFGDKQTTQQATKLRDATFLCKEVHREDVTVWWNVNNEFQVKRSKHQRHEDVEATNIHDGEENFDKIKKANKTQDENEKKAFGFVNKVNEHDPKALKYDQKFNRDITHFPKVLIPLMLINLSTQASAVEMMTSRMLAEFLGYPSTCTFGSEVRACTLTLACWLGGGSRVRGCGGGWLFSCCAPNDEPPESNNELDNSIPASEWRFKVTPPKLRKVPTRNAIHSNVFRRRVDEDYAQTDCGIPASKLLRKRIIGGREARFAEFPWQAHVRISEFQCGGVLVSRRYVATAAHCVSRARPKDIAVWLGALDTTAGNPDARRLGVVQKILHPLFQFRMTQPDRYDVALLKLSRPINFMSHILPICLPDFELELRGRSGVIAGWGKTDTSNGHTGTNILRSAVVPILSTEQCIEWHESKQISVEIHPEMICAGHSDGHQDACLGDSGGPLIVMESGRYYLVGITSAGFGCGVDHQPGIYHNIQTTGSWIRRIIGTAMT